MLRSLLQRAGFFSPANGSANPRLGKLIKLGGEGGEPRPRPNAGENGQIRPATKRSGYPRCW